MAWYGRYMGYRLGEAVPVYHNICGTRTTFEQCACEVCRGVLASQAAISAMKGERG